MEAGNSGGTLGDSDSAHRRDTRCGFNLSFGLGGASESSTDSWSCPGSCRSGTSTLGTGFCLGCVGSSSAVALRAAGKGGGFERDFLRSGCADFGRWAVVPFAADSS